MLVKEATYLITLEQKDCRRHQIRNTVLIYSWLLRGIRLAPSDFFNAKWQKLLD